MPLAQLCDNVTRMAHELDRLCNLGHADSCRVVVMRMKLAAMTTELIYTDLIERLRG